MARLGSEMPNMRELYKKGKCAIFSSVLVRRPNEKALHNEVSDAGLQFCGAGGCDFGDGFGCVAG
jgi:hypothetical protein